MALMVYSIKHSPTFTSGFMAVHSRALVDVDCSSIFFAFGSNNFFVSVMPFVPVSSVFFEIFIPFFFHIDNCRYEQIVLLSSQA